MVSSMLRMLLVLRKAEFSESKTTAHMIIAPRRPPSRLHDLSALRPVVQLAARSFRDLRSAARGADGTVLQPASRGRAVGLNPASRPGRTNFRLHRFFCSVTCSR